MKLIVQPEGGIGPILDAIDGAKRAVDILIFRLDCKSVTRCLEKAVARGITVRALIASKHRGGASDLRRLERRLLRAGVILARTSGDLTRYHGKMMIVDRRVLHVYGFNYTRQDYASRSFGVVTTKPSLVKEALALFQADATRTRYRARHESFVVSPVNSRERLSAFIRGARRELLIYDPRFTDRSIGKLLAQRKQDGVKIRVIGKAHRRIKAILDVRKYPGVRLHVRAIVRDGQDAFVGSQSLGRMAFDDRREIGLIVRNADIARRIRSIFERDWTSGR